MSFDHGEKWGSAAPLGLHSTGVVTSNSEVSGEHLGASPTTVVNKSCMNRSVQISVWGLGICPEVQVLDHMVILYFTFLSNC